MTQVWRLGHEKPSQRKQRKKFSRKFFREYNYIRYLAEFVHWGLNKDKQAVGGRNSGAGNASDCMEQ